MKSLKESLFDKKGTLDRSVYKYHPRTKKELINCIRTEIDLQGPDANLNCIDIRAITTMNWLFKDFSAGDIQNIDISMWDVSGVENMDSMFYGCKKFNCDLSGWDVGKVQDMRRMFTSCDKFNSDLSQWDVSNVEDMDYMFFGCDNFDSDLSRWDVSKVKNMVSMFSGCINFNSDLSKWNVSKVENMSFMFNDCNSLKKIPSWYESE